LWWQASQPGRAMTANRSFCSARQSRRYNSAMPIASQRTKSKPCGNISCSGAKTVTGAVDGYKNGYTRGAVQVFPYVKLN
jgi:hypothetical protein